MKKLLSNRILVAPLVMLAFILAFFLCDSFKSPQISTNAGQHQHSHEQPHSEPMHHQSMVITLAPTLGDSSFVNQLVHFVANVFVSLSELATPRSVSIFILFYFLVVKTLLYISIQLRRGILTPKLF